MQSSGNGAIVTERLVERFAEARGYKAEECELVTVMDEDTGKLLWPRD